MIMMNMNNNPSHLIIDLGDATSLLAASSLLDMGGLCARQKVKRAQIINSGDECTSQRCLENTLLALYNLPNLASLTLNLGELALSIPALNVMLQSTVTLKSLTIRNLKMVPAKSCDWQDLEQALAWSSIRKVTLQGPGCQTAAVTTKKNHLSKVKLFGMSLGTKSPSKTSGSYLRLLRKCLCKLHDLDTLILQDIVDDAHQVQDLAAALKNKNKLERLHIQSSHPRDHEVGDAIVKAMLDNISEVTVSLGGEDHSWETDQVRPCPVKQRVAAVCA